MKVVNVVSENGKIFKIRCMVSEQKVFFNRNIIIVFIFFPGKCRNHQFFTHFDFKTSTKFSIKGSIGATTLKFINNSRTQKRWNSVFKYKSVINFSQELNFPSEIIVREFAFIIKFVLVNI